MKQYVSKKVEEQRVHQEKKEESQEHSGGGKGKSKKYVVASSIVLLVILAVGFFVYSTYAKPSVLDGFAKCLADKGVVLYGADWCQYTKAQRAMFGSSFKHLNYKDISERGDLNIKITPTWIINSNFYERVQSFETLASLTGCVLPRA